MKRSSILRSITGCWICPGYFFRFTFIIDLFFLLTFLNINGTTTLHTNVSLTTGIPQHCLSCRLDVLVNFGKIFALFLGAFVVDFEYYLPIMNATLWHSFVENQKRVILMGVVAKHYFPTVRMIKVFFSDIFLEVAMATSFFIFIISYWANLFKVINEI